SLARARAWRRPMGSLPLGETTLICPEAQVLLCCAQSCHNPANTKQLSSLLRQRLDWDSVIQLAQRQRGLPLVYRDLHGVNSDAVPQAIRAALYRHFHASAQRNLFLAGTLLKLLRLLESHHIPAIAYKGPVLAMLAYGNLALRQLATWIFWCTKKTWRVPK